MKGSQGRKKEAEGQLKASSKEVEMLEPQHLKLKKQRDEKKKSFKNSQVAL